MSEKPTIEIFRRKDAEDFTKALADPDSRTAVGSGAAMTAAIAAAYLNRAAARTVKEQAGDERADYILRNSETLRQYMVKLIDEDVKCRGPLRRALKEGDARTIEAAHQPAVAITQEIVCMMTQALELMNELADKAPAEGKTSLAAAAQLAMGAIRAAIRYTVDMSSECGDETYRFVIRRENEITLEQYGPVYESVLKRTAE